MDDRVITMIYKNYRGEVSQRTVTPYSIDWLGTYWHPEPQWILTGFDHGKNEVRSFALVDCDFLNGQQINTK